MTVPSVVLGVGVCALDADALALAALEKKRDELLKELEAQNFEIREAN